MEDFRREREIQELLSFVGNGKVNIVAGLRRVGKTYLLDTVFKNRLIKEEKLFSEEDLAFLYLDSKDKNIRTEKQLDNALSKIVKQGKKIVIIDEVQLAKGFASSLTAFVKEHKDITVYVTGSNSDILSTDIINAFQSYEKTIIVYPLTYKEIKENLPEYLFEDYVNYGGLPIIVKTPVDQKQYELDKIFKELYERDIKQRCNKKLENLPVSKITDIIHTIADSSTPISPAEMAKNLLNGLERNKEDIIKTAAEINDVLSVMEDSFFLKHIKVDDYFNKTPLENLGLNKKYYFADNGLRFINCLDYRKATGNCLENAVFLELFTKGINPTGKFINGTNNNGGEIDFSYSINGQAYLVQVTHTINTNDYEREISRLKDYQPDATKIVVYLFNSTGLEEENLTYKKNDAFFDC